MNLQTETSHLTQASHAAAASTTPAFQVWTMTSHADEARCIVDVVPLGVEVRYVLNGSLLSSRRFQCSDEALLWATRKQLKLQTRGWEQA